MYASFVLTLLQATRQAVEAQRASLGPPDARSLFRRHTHAIAPARSHHCMFASCALCVVFYYLSYIQNGILGDMRAWAAHARRTDTMLHEVRTDVDA